MKKHLAAVLFTTVFLLHTYRVGLAFAATPAVAVNLDTRVMEISGTVTGAAREYAAVYVTKLPVEQIDTAAINRGDVLVLTERCDLTGSYRFSFRLPAAWPSGEYWVYVNCGGESAGCSFLYTNKTLAEEALKLINKAAGEALGELLFQYLADFGLEEEEFLVNKRFICSNVETGRPAGGYTLEGFITAYKTGAALGCINNESMGFADVLQRYSAYLGVTADAWNVLPDAVKADVEWLFKNRAYNHLKFKDAFSDYVLLASVRTSQDAEALKSTILSNCGVMGISLEKYNAIGNEYYQNNVFVSLYNPMKSVKEFSEIKSLFDAETQNQKEAYEAYLSKNNGASSGGGGRGGGGAAYVPKDDAAYVYQPAAHETSEDGTAVFSDTNGHWAEPEILTFAQKGIMTGYPDGTFKPDAAVTRAEFAAMLCRLLDLQPVYAAAFSDVGPDAWYYGFIGAAANLGIVNGYQNSFLPDSLICRQDMAVMLDRVLKSFYGLDLSGTGSFEDQDEISDYAVGAVNRLAAVQIVSGFDGRFAPLEYASRAQAVTILHNLLGYIGR